MHCECFQKSFNRFLQICAGSTALQFNCSAFRQFIKSTRYEVTEVTTPFDLSRRKFFWRDGWIHPCQVQYEKSTMAFIGDWSCSLCKSNLKNRRTWRVLESVVELGHTFVFLIRATLGELKKLGMDSLSGGHSCHQVFINDTETVSKLFHWNCWKIFFHFRG